MPLSCNFSSWYLFIFIIFFGHEIKIVVVVVVVNSVNSGNMKQRNSLTSNNKQTGRRPADMLDIYKLIYLI